MPVIAIVRGWLGPKNPQFARLLQCTKLSVILTTLVETDLVGEI